MAEEAEAQKYPQMTDEHLQTALTASKGPNAKLVSWEVKDFTKKGDNYACIVTSVIIQYTLDGVPKETTFIAKLNRNLPMPAMEKMMQRIFIREGSCLSEVVPGINNTLTQLGHRPIGIAKAYHCTYEKGKEILLLEDLRSRGFKMFDRRRGMDVAHATLVLQELGKLHAASLLFEKTLESQNILETWDCFVDDWITNDDSKRLFYSMTQNQLDGAAMIMEKVPNYERVVKWIREVKKTSMDTIIKSFTSAKVQGVLIHGDCWNNNVLFRYDEAGVPVEVMLVDLQGMRKTSPAIDLNYFLYSSFNGCDRVENKEKFLKSYYDSFCSVLEDGDMPAPFTYDELQQEVREHMLYGAIIAMFLIPIVLSDVDDVPSFDNLTEDNLEEFSKERKKVLLNMSERDDNLLKPRFLDMFDELLEEGLIQ